MKTQKKQQKEQSKSSLANAELTRIIQESVLQNASKTSHDIAKEIDKPYPTLMREIHPEDMGAKVGVNDLLPLMRVTGSIAPLTYLASSMGYVLVPHGLGIKDTDQPTLMSLDLMDCFGKYANALKAALKGGVSDSRVLLDAEKYGHEAMTAIMTMCHYLRKQAEQKVLDEGDPTHSS